VRGEALDVASLLGGSKGARHALPVLLLQEGACTNTSLGPLGSYVAVKQSSICRSKLLVSSLVQATGAGVLQIGVSGISTEEREGGKRLQQYPSLEGVHCALHWSSNLTSPQREPFRTLGYAQLVQSVQSSVETVFPVWAPL